MSENPNRPVETIPSGGNHLYSMPIQGQIGDMHVGAATGGGGEPQMIAEEHAIQQYADDDGGGVEGMDEDHEHDRDYDGDLGQDPGHLVDQHTAIAPHIGSNQLTLSFQGEVYVFDSVSPEKVIFLLLLLLSIIYRS